jgi:hypothetical protein
MDRPVKPGDDNREEIERRLIFKKAIGANAMKPQGKLSLKMAGRVG